MPPSAEPSNIRAFVHWDNPTIYAGEEIQCVITFKNVARSERNGKDVQEKAVPIANGTSRETRRASYAQSVVAAPSRKASTAQNNSALVRVPSLPRDAPQTHGHRPALSLNVASAVPRASLQSAKVMQSPVSASRSKKGHGRSLSIVSIGVESPSDARSSTIMGTGKASAKGHTRSASLQHMPRFTMPQAAPSQVFQSPRQPSPLYESATPPSSTTEASGQALPIRPMRRRPGTMSAGNTPQLGKSPGVTKQHSFDSHGGNFKFPSTSVADPGAAHNVEMPKPVRTPSNMHSGQTRHFSPRPLPDGWSTNASSLNPLTRVMSESSVDGTPRSSSEMYTISNHSNETLTSEAPYNLNSGRLMTKSSHSRQASRSPQQRPPEQETLMMAYAQTSGQFTLDGSLVNGAPFEEVKRRGVQGGGGVVGVEKSKRPSSMFGAFSWGNIGESLGGLLGNDDMSSIAQMKANAGTKEIPLLSTPQSLLFVDLDLAPGESKSFKYSFTLPRGLPPTYRGRAIKVSYHVVLGVQRPEGQLVREVEVPFRVLGSYDARGDALGHDLMQPYVLLQDAAQVTTVSPELLSKEIWSLFPKQNEAKNSATPKQGLEDFLRYTERLLETPTDTTAALTSPTSPSVHTMTLSRQGSLAGQTIPSVKEAIDFAIIRSNIVASANKAHGNHGQSTNRFNIARSGQPVAVLTILRPAFRLGEAVTGVLDFTAPTMAAALPPQTSTYSVLIELESVEDVDPTLAIRSGTSISRVTRKVYASMRENTLFARRVTFYLAIPASASPSFETTGVSLNWRLKIEFTTQRQTHGLGLQQSDDRDRNLTSGHLPGEDDLLENLANDERGTTVVAKESLVADSFEIAVPLRIYGAVGIDCGPAESEALEV